MAKLYFILSEEDQEKLSQIYEQLTGRKLKPPKRDERLIHCEAKLESPREIAKIMEQTPNYPLDVQGREG